MKREDWSTRPLDDELGEALRAELLGWPGVVLRPMMGTMAFCRGKQMLGCYVNRELFQKAKKPAWANKPGEPPFVWVRLQPGDAERAIRRPHVRWPRPKFASWVEVPLASRAALEEAVRWLGCAYEHPRGNASRRRK